MPLEVDFSISDTFATEDEEVPDCPRAELITQWARQAFLSSQDRVASVQIVSENEMQDLNRDWRGKDCSTNVLSFPMSLDEDIALFLSDEEPCTVPLGDIALCAAVINREAAEQDKRAEAHWAHMVVHGMLHLQGYDHLQDKEAEQMETLEIQILQTLGFDNPYLASHA